eukprot:CAMPEP_0118656556 /NCGR_PEP_ID=MMETSP0785-20121206/13550_1 /TAXON_ID=91992 /ORGANISM="Bolidomonas pacifica, Strain CCMP 1866" /LENGTH=372 /DNA_ID=CAMNT_0006549419 /DNA_START=76 /DNA_END=1191 /DNA_ORIENTATION=-
MTTPLIVPQLFLLFLLLDTSLSISLKWRSLNTTLYPNALCNDGSPAGYYVSDTTDKGEQGKGKFFIYLESGGWCYDDISCKKRYENSFSLMSTTTIEDTKEVGGIFDSHVLEGYTKVWVHYCTSDGHMGNLTSPSSSDFVFNGYSVVRSVVETLNSAYDINDRGGRVVFGGASAGGRGGMVHLDWVNSYFDNVEVMGVLDSPLWVDLDPPVWSSKIGLKNQTRLVYDMADVPDDVLGEECLRDRKSVGEEWMCMYGEYRMRYIRTAHMLVSSQFDSYQIGQDLDASKPTTDRSVEFATEFGDKMISTLKSLSSSSPPSLLYSTPCFNHAISLSPSFYTVSNVDGATWEDALEVFMEGMEEGGNVDMVIGCKE